jgi:hypothetical protein
MKRQQVCEVVKNKCGCEKWHYIKKNGIEVLSVKYKECHPKTVSK